MIILDTDILSAIVKATNTSLFRWLDGQVDEEVYISSISVYEVIFGIAMMPEGKKKRLLTGAFAKFLEKYLEGRIIPFDEDAASHTAQIHASRKKIGLNIGLRDTMIAGSAISRRATIATRNTKDFVGLNVLVINPWESSSKLT